MLRHTVSRLISAEMRSILIDYHSIVDSDQLSKYLHLYMFVWFLPKAIYNKLFSASTSQVMDIIFIWFTSAIPPTVD